MPQKYTEETCGRTFRQEDLAQLIGKCAWSTYTRNGKDNFVRVTATQIAKRDWVAYIAGVHTKMLAVKLDIRIVSHGIKLKQAEAEVLFPDWARKYIWYLE